MCSHSVSQIFFTIERNQLELPARRVVVKWTLPHTVPAGAGEEIRTPTFTLASLAVNLIY